MAKRKQISLGSHLFNDGEPNKVSADRYELDKTRKFYIFDVIPMGAVRMTQSDRWKKDPNHANPLKRQRTAVGKYFAFKTLLQLQAKQLKFTLDKTLDAVYLIPMPDSWSKKKKEAMNGMPCLSKPDTDNITKAVKDALLKDDHAVWWERAEKRWAFKGSIIVFV